MNMFEYLMLGDVRARKYSKTGARTSSILEKFAFDTTLETSIIDDSTLKHLLIPKIQNY